VPERQAIALPLGTLRVARSGESVAHGVPGILLV
jgi:hypothetical protein